MPLQIRSGFAELEEANPGLHVTEGVEMIVQLPDNQLGGQVTGGGVYTIWRDDEQRCVHLKSPFSGYYMYHFDTENGCWMSDKESHNLLELLLRELIIVCNGLPSWVL